MRGKGGGRGNEAVAVNTDNLIFYHIPKTGGTWVKTAMSNAGIEHKKVSIRKYRHPLAPMVFYTHATPECIRDGHKRGRLAFCFVRHPVDWYISFWCDQQRVKGHKSKWWLDDLRHLSCGDWTNAILDKYPSGFVSELYGYYVDQVDFIGKAESLTDDLIHVLEMAGEPCDADKLASTPPANTAGAERQRAAVSETTIQRILTCERQVTDRFYRGYQRVGDWL